MGVYVRSIKRKKTSSESEWLETWHSNTAVYRSLSKPIDFGLKGSRVRLQRPLACVLSDHWRTHDDEPLPLPIFIVGVDLHIHRAHIKDWCNRLLPDAAADSARNTGWDAHTARVAQQCLHANCLLKPKLHALIRFVVDLLYNLLYNKSTTNRINGVWAKGFRRNNGHITLQIWTPADVMQAERCAKLFESVIRSQKQFLNWKLHWRRHGEIFYWVLERGKQSTCRVVVVEDILNICYNSKKCSRLTAIALSWMKLVWDHFW